jgi:hypothetical protein
VRCGLAHAYVIDSSGDTKIDTGNLGLHGIEYHNSTRGYTFWVKTYFDEFKNAVDAYINGLKSGVENLTYLENSLNGRPELI